MKLFLALGPGDIVGAARLRMAGQPAPGISIPFSEQILEYCKGENIETLAISSHPRADALRDGDILIENRAKVFKNGGRIRLNLAALHYVLSLAFRAKRFGAELAIIDSGTAQYFLLAIFRLLGMQVAVNLHNVLWPVGFPPRKKSTQILRSLNAWFFRNIAAGATGVSPECERQFLNESHNRVPFFQYRAQYLIDGFHQAKPYVGGPFKIACVGRAEESKGFLDVAEIAGRLQIRSKVPVVFHICGSGPAIPELKRIVQERNLGKNVIMEGHLERTALLKIYADLHAAIVPTRSTFCEGMPQVCAEAVLSGLPVITSPVSNAFDVIGPAIVRAKTDDIESYVSAICDLISDRKLQKEIRAQCPNLAKQFVDNSQGYGAATHRLVMALLSKQV